MKDYLFTYPKKRQYLLLVGDILFICLSIFLSYLIRVHLNISNQSIDWVFSRLRPILFIVVIAHIFTLYLFDQYNVGRLGNLLRSAVMVILSIWLAGLVLSGALFFFPKYVFGRQVLLIHLFVVSGIMVTWRWLAAAVLIKNGKAKKLAIVGDGQIISSFIEELSKIPNCGFDVTDVCLVGSDDSVVSCFPEGTERPKSISDLIDSDGYEALAFDTTNSSFTNEEVRRILELKYKGKAVYDLPTLYKSLTGKVPLTYIDGRWLLTSGGLQGEINASYARVKRTIDFAAASLLILVLSPLLLLIALAIKLDSKGTVLFSQERLGIHKRPFRCIKFRTMIKNAEQENGPMWASEDDPRITQVGRFLRRSRLDEIPQLWNVLRGDMSFVGPRPIREYFANDLSKTIPFYALRFGVKPGLSGWAQVNFDYAGSKEGQLEKFQYELFYIQNMSFFLDVLTMAKTVHRMFRGGGGT